jgi:hypothetical protein
LYLFIVNFPFENWQKDAMWQQITHKKSAKIQSRRTGKTHCTVTAFVFCILYFPPKSKKSAYFVNTEDQMNPVDEFLSTNPFAKHQSQKWYSVGEDRWLRLSALTLNTSESETFDHVVFDEVQDMKGKESILHSAEITVRNNPLSRTHYNGHPWYASPFEKKWNECEIKIQHHWSEVQGNWLDKDGVEDDRKNMEPWEFDMQYENKWTVPHGAVFPNIVVHQMSDPSKDNYVKVWPHTSQWGIDQGARDHAVGGTWIGEDDIWVTEEREFDFASDPESLSFVRGCNYEVENVADPTYNIQGEAEAMAMYAGGVLMRIDQEFKRERQYKARHCCIHVCVQLTPRTYADLHSAELGNDGLYLKEGYNSGGRKPCHWLESFLHMIGCPPFKVYTGGKTAYYSSG